MPKENIDHFKLILSLYKFRKHFGEMTPEYAIILGTGLGEIFSQELKSKTEVSYEALVLPTPQTEGHAGRLTVGYLQDKLVAIGSGRVHLYDGYSSDDVVRMVRMLALSGVKNFIFTTAAGALDRENQNVPGIMLICDHLNLSGTNPLVGKNVNSLGTRFTAMTDAYSVELLSRALLCSFLLDIPVSVGVYACMLGPNFETPSEVRMLKNLGADAAGMSVVNEVIALQHMKNFIDYEQTMGSKTKVLNKREINILGITSLTNWGAGLDDKTINHEDNQLMTKTINPLIRKMITKVVSQSFKELSDEFKQQTAEFKKKP